METLTCDGCGRTDARGGAGWRMLSWPEYDLSALGDPYPKHACSWMCLLLIAMRGEYVEKRNPSSSPRPPDLPIHGEALNRISAATFFWGEITRIWAKNTQAK